MNATKKYVQGLDHLDPQELAQAVRAAAAKASAKAAAKTKVKKEPQTPVAAGTSSVATISDEEGDIQIVEKPTAN